MVGLFDVVTYHNFGTVLAHTLPYVGIQLPGKKRDRKGSGESYFFFEAYTSWEFNINADPEIALFTKDILFAKPDCSYLY